jgi:hypothetical protein
MSVKLYDFHSLNALAKELGRPKQSLHALDPSGDPFNCGSPAQVEAAKWFADLWHEHMRPGGHIRRFHYKLVVLANIPMHGGGVYVNNHYCYAVLNRVSQWARYLDLVGIDDIVDRRNPSPRIYLDYPSEASIELERLGLWDTHVPEFPDLPRLNLAPPQVVQPYHLEIWVEKSDIEDIVLPIASVRRLNYLPFLGQPSLSACRDLVDRAELSGRPVRILYISDFDPQGQSMPVAAARKIEWLLAKRGLDLDIELRPVALTKEQCVEFQLPRTPIKETDKLKSAFEKRHGEGATELDALEAIHPGVLRDLIITEVDRYYDHDLQDRVDAEESRISAVLRTVTQACVASHTASVEALREDYERIIGELKSWRQQAAPVWQRIAADLQKESPDLSEHYWPEGEPGEEHPNPLFDSYRDYVDQIAVYKRFQCKSIEDGRRAANQARAKRYDNGAEP